MTMMVVLHDVTAVAVKLSHIDSVLLTNLSSTRRVTSPPSPSIKYSLITPCPLFHCPPPEPSHHSMRVLDCDEHDYDRWWIHSAAAEVIDRW
jgi:hypothetical protein